MPNTPRVSEKGRARARAALLSLCALLSAAPPALAAAAPPQKNRPKPAAERPAATKPRAGARVPQETLLRIMAAEDERRWEESDLGALLKDASAAVRARAALAAGRIGDEGAVGPLAALLGADRDQTVRATAAFALGEV
ncbi:MAG TPA: HEAT repeat domain-containing protein, partial [Pyrinomonadaceae bacterium]